MGTVSYSNYTTTEYTYGPKSGRMVNITSGPPLPSDPFIDKTYVYSPAGDIKSIEDAVLGITYSYEYDGLHRLLSESDDAGGASSSASSSSYHYDAASVHGVDAVASSEVGVKSYDYDLNGNMVSAKDGSGTPVKTIAYNAGNMPVSIENTEGGNSTTSFSYYAGGEARAKKAVTEGALTKTTHYISSAYEYDVESAQAMVYIFAGNMRIASVKGNVAHYFHKDHLGSTSRTSNELEPGDPDGDPEVVEDAQYLPYGSMRSHWTSGGAVSDYKFTDQELDDTTGLYNYDARLYDPSTGLFISSDSIVPDWYDPQSLNRYAYCRNNPLIYTDPSGHNPLLLLAAAVWSVVEFALSASDVASTVATLADEDASFREKATSVSLTAAGIVAPGGGGSTALRHGGKKAKALVERVADTVESASKKTHMHHQTPREILNKHLPPDVANNPNVRGKRGMPNRREIEVDEHKRIHKGEGGGLVNELTKKKLEDLGREPTVEDVLRIRNEVNIELGIKYVD